MLRSIAIAGAAMLLSACSNSAPELIANDPAIRAFDAQLQWLADRHMSNGYIISDSTNPAHLHLVPISEAPADFGRVGIGYLAEERIYDRHAFLTDDQETLLVVDDGELASVPRDHALPFAPEFYFTEARNGHIRLRLGFLYDNTDAALALTHMFTLTGNDRYLEVADGILRKAYSLVNEEGQYIRQFADEDEPYYTGMAQAILMGALFEYAQVSGEQWAADGAKRMAEGFRHTTEGVWNHWTNSAIGSIYAGRLGVVDTALEARIADEFQQIIAQIEELAGPMPHFISRENAHWPGSKSTYQPYDLFLLLQMAELAPTVAGAICSIYSTAWSVLPKPRSGRNLGRNAFTAYRAEKVCGIDDGGFIEAAVATALEQEGQPARVRDAIGTMTLLTAHMMARNPDMTPPTSASQPRQ